MAIGEMRQLHAVDACSVMMMLAAVRWAIFLVRGRMIFRAATVGIMLRVVVVVRFGVSVFQSGLRTAFSLGSHAAKQAKLDQQAENDGSGVSHAAAQSCYPWEEGGATTLFPHIGAYSHVLTVGPGLWKRRLPARHHVE